MIEYIYCDNEKYYREITDLLGNPLIKEEISKEEYLRYKE